MFCWYCHFGWSEEVCQIYEKYYPIAGYYAMHYGAAHIVWEDENFKRKHVQWCLDHFEEYKREDSSPTENLAVRNSLLDLLELPDAILNPEPEDFDGINFDKYPPKIKVRHVSK